MRLVLEAMDKVTPILGGQNQVDTHIDPTTDGNLSRNRVDTTIVPTTDGDNVFVSLCSFTFVVSCCGPREKTPPPPPP